ncbi:hypothetical protein ACSS6W_007308 [Trichoderma asperelloides]|nr:hypothetical protein LI328DRAFT_168250 [Trichoderma asperelloides]
MDTSSSEDDLTASFPDGYTAPRTTEQLMQYHKDHSTSASVDPIISMHNIEKRLRMIEQIQKGGPKDFQFTYFQLAYFLLSPESSLQKIMDDRFHGTFLETQMKYLESWLLGNESQWRDNSPRHNIDPETSQHNEERIEQLKRGEENIQHKKAEKEKCLVRDNYRCVLTQEESPKVCQVLPFVASYGNWTFIQLLDLSLCLSVVLGPQAWSELNAFVCTGSDRCDKSWNMMSFGINLHVLWKGHFFGIQCLGILPIDRQASAIWLQFHWMPRNELDPKCRAEPNMDTVQKMLQIISPDKKDLVKYCRSRMHCPPETGHIFSIRMGKQAAVNMKHVIDLRWTMVRIATVSGLARSRSIYK